MTYLDTGCLVKLYYPEPDSSRLISCIADRTLCYAPLHELELTNALQLKVFLQSANLAQVAAARALVEADLQAGVLTRPAGDWAEVFQAAARLAERNTSSLGCRSLDVLHCAAAQFFKAEEFITTDKRQKQLVLMIGLNVVTF